MSPLTFALTPEQFEAATEKVFNEHQILINTAATSGQINSHGVVANWTYDEKELTIDVIKKPWILSDGQVIKGLTDLFGSLRG